MGMWQEGDITDNDLRLHYYRTGGVKPPVVCVHGFTDNALYWISVAQALESAYDVVMYDARGHGSSDRAKGQFTEQDRVDDLLRVIRALNLEQPGLIGHSMGAATIASAVAQQPGLARWAVLEDPAWMDMPVPSSVHEAAKIVQERFARFEAWREWVTGLQVAPWKQALQWLRSRSPRWSEADAKRSLYARRQFEMDLFNIFPHEGMEWREVVRHISTPFLLLTAEVSQGGVVTPQIAQEAAHMVPACRWVHIEGTGHSIRFDDFEAYFRAVKSFLGEIDNVDL